MIRPRISLFRGRTKGIPGSIPLLRMAGNHAGQGFPLWAPVLFRLVFPRSLRENRIRKIVTGVSPTTGLWISLKDLSGFCLLSDELTGFGFLTTGTTVLLGLVSGGATGSAIILKLVRFRILLKFTTKEWNAGQDGKYDSVHGLRQLILLWFSSSDHSNRLFFQSTEAGFPFEGIVFLSNGPVRFIFQG